MELPVNINRTAAAVVAAAISEVFPGSELFGGGETDTGFFYQFFYSHPLPPEASKLLEEKMRQMIREDRPLREMEMVACSAKELFLKADHPAAVDLLEEFSPKELVSVVKIGSFVDLAEGPFCPSIREVGAFQITALKFLSDGEIRVEGSAFALKDELKQFLKKLSNYSEQNHLVRGQTLKLWQWRGVHLLWLSRGLRMRRALLSFLKKSFGGEELRSASEAAMDAYCLKRAPFTAITVQEKFHDPEEGRGLFEEGCQSIIQQTVYCSLKDLKDFAISLLQTIDKTLIILGFHASSRLVGRERSETGSADSLKRLEQVLGLKAAFSPEGRAAGAARDGNKAQWIVEDGFGRSQVVLELSLREEEASMLRINIRVEKILALLLEKSDVGLQLIENWEKSD